MMAAWAWWAAGVASGLLGLAGLLPVSVAVVLLAVALFGCWREVVKLFGRG